jgi:hypothetical protein
MSETPDVSEYRRQNGPHDVVDRDNKLRYTSRHSEFSAAKSLTFQAGVIIGEFKAKVN